MRTIYLARHGRPDFPDGEKRCIGWTDVPLSEEGRRQIEALGRRLAEDSWAEIEAIYVSPLTRCVESARIVRDMLQQADGSAAGGAGRRNGWIPIYIVEELQEIHMGEWENLPFSQIKARFPEAYEARGRDIARFAPKGGESFQDVQRRAVAALERIRRGSRGNILIMAHAGVNRTLISELEKRPLKKLLEIPQEYGGLYRYEEAVFDGLIAAAGLSSRMGDFKPLMDLNGTKVIHRELDTLRAGGAREIAVVTGRRSGDVAQAVRSRFSFSGDADSRWYPELDAPEDALEQPDDRANGVRILKNEAYATTKMFDSVSIGLRYFKEKMARPEGRTLDGIFFLPVDVPLFTRFTMECEKREFAKGLGDVYCPSCEGEAGHPLLIRASAIETLLAHDGERGLKGAYERLGDRVIRLDVPDPGAAMDADRPEEFERLRMYEANRSVPDEAACRRLLSWFHVREDTVRHGEAVAALALELADLAEKRLTGISLDRRLISAAALLHDMAKGQPDHAAAGGRILSMLGHERTAQVVADHMDLPKEKLAVPGESLIVYLADKLVRGKRRVTLEERFSEKRAQFAGNPAALTGLERRLDKARRAYQLVFGEKSIEFL